MFNNSASSPQLQFTVATRWTMIGVCLCCSRIRQREMFCFHGVSVSPGFFYKPHTCIQTPSQYFNMLSHFLNVTRRGYDSGGKAAAGSFLGEDIIYYLCTSSLCVQLFLLPGLN